MAQNKRELIDAVFHNRKADRVPTGFWHHYLPHPHTDNAFEAPALTDEVFEKQAAFYEASDPDILKLMTDGFFPYPNPVLAGKLTSVHEIEDIAPLGKDSEWYKAQIAFAKKWVEKYGATVEIFYNLFTPWRAVQFSQEIVENPFDLVAWIHEDKEAVKKVLDVISSDYALLAEGLIREAGVDGVYFSVNNVDRTRLTEAEYKEVVAPSELKVLAAANAAKDNNILHICGFKGFRNYLDWYKDYPVLVINWAAHVEEVPLSEGKKLFGGRAVIGGFGQTPDDLIYKGTKEEIERETARILADSGLVGVMLGADCTIPPDTSLDRLRWVREKATELSK